MGELTTDPLQVPVMAGGQSEFLEISVEVQASTEAACLDVAREAVKDVLRVRGVDATKIVLVELAGG